MFWTVPALLLIAVYCWFRWSHRELLSTAAKLPYFFPAFPIVGHVYLSFWGRDAWGSKPPTYVDSRGSIALVFGMKKMAGEDEIERESAKLEPLGSRTEGSIPTDIEKAVNFEMTRYVIEMSKRAVAKGLSTVVLWCGPLPIIVVHGMDDIQMILNNSNTIEKSDEYEFFKFGLEYGEGEFKYSILTAPGQVWKKTRKHLNPLFHPRNLQHMVPVFNQNSRELASCLSEHVGKGPINLMPHTMDTALKTVCNLLFGPGVEIDVKSEEFRGLMFFVETIPEIFINRMMWPWLRIEPLFRFLYRKELAKLNRTWRNFTETPIQMVRAKSELKQINSNPSNSGVNGQPNIEDNQQYDEPLNIVNAFRVLQQNYPEFTEADMICETLSFYCTGTDTVGSGVASCLLALAHYQHIQERLYQEVCSAVGLDDDITLEDLNKMPYLDQVIKETLRWFILVPYIMRRAGKDINISSCTIPAGNTIVISLAGIHLDPKLHEDPHKFDPERFSPENLVDKERFSFIPFSGGPRNCIAKTYSMQLMKIMVVHVLRKYKLRTDMDIFKLRKRLVVTLLNLDGYHISFQER